MARKPSDKPPFDESLPPSGHAAERLKQFERARQPMPVPPPAEPSVGQTPGPSSRAKPPPARKKSSHLSKRASHQPAVKEKPK